MALPNSKTLNFRQQEIQTATVDFFPLRGDTTTATQQTNRTTAVTVDSVVGQITTNTTALGAAAEATFTVNNKYVSSKDVVVLSIASGAAATPIAWVSAVANGSFAITLSNLHAATDETGAIVINFIVLGGN